MLLLDFFSCVPSLSEDERCTAAAGVRSSEDGSLSNTRRRVTPVRMANSRIVLEGRVSSEENTMCNQPALKRLVKRGNDGTTLIS